MGLFFLEQIENLLQISPVPHWSNFFNFADNTLCFTFASPDIQKNWVQPHCCKVLVSCSDRVAVKSCQKSVWNGLILGKGLCEPIRAQCHITQNPSVSDGYLNIRTIIISILAVTKQGEIQFWNRLTDGLTDGHTDVQTETQVHLLSWA